MSTLTAIGAAVQPVFNERAQRSQGARLEMLKGGNIQGHCHNLNRHHNLNLLRSTITIKSRIMIKTPPIQHSISDIHFSFAIRHLQSAVFASLIAALHLCVESLFRFPLFSFSDC
jgi:hypothetical protein